MSSSKIVQVNQTNKQVGVLGGIAVAEMSPTQVSPHQIF